MADVISKLREKGWSEEEVMKALELIHAEDKKEKHIHMKKSMNITLYWMVLLILTLANFFISIVMIPFLLVLETFQVMIILGAVGIVFGLVFNHLIRDIEHVETKHNVAAAIFIPSLAIINIFVVVTVANAMAERLRFDAWENPVLIAAIYALAFVLPYLLTSVKEYARNKARMEQVVK